MQCARLEQLYADIGTRLAEAQAERDAAATGSSRSTMAGSTGARLRPSGRGKGASHGKRGALKQAILEVISMNFPLEVSTSEIAWVLGLRFDIGFETPDEAGALACTTPWAGPFAY